MTHADYDMNYSKGAGRHDTGRYKPARIGTVRLDRDTGDYDSWL
jgi:hypothetical protein